PSPSRRPAKIPLGAVPGTGSALWAARIRSRGRRKCRIVRTGGKETMSNRQAMPTCRPMSGSQGDRVRRIMDITRALLLEFGVKRRTIDELGRMADIGKGTAYLSWETKDYLIRAMVILAIIDLCGDVSNGAGSLSDALTLPSRSRRMVTLI